MGASFAVGLLPSEKFAALTLGRLLDDLRRDPHPLDDVLVEHEDPAAAIAPIASSSLPGTPSLRTRKTSSGASRAMAISYATGTPPRGSPTTMTSGVSRWFARSPARTRPASCRS
ncbi:hypothetical protein ACFQX6_60620 [Streptosporangium lutulentum]